MYLQYKLIYKETYVFLNQFLLFMRFLYFFTFRKVYNNIRNSCIERIDFNACSHSIFLN